MQPHDKVGSPLGPPEPFDAEKMKELLDKPKVDHVRVFRLRKDDTLNIRGQEYVVTKIMNGGRAVIKMKKKG